ncbi:MAG: hypothetical protein WDN00_07430 [Limisphaerales bacterium]
MFQLALGNVPVSFGSKNIHIFDLFVSSRRLGGTKFYFAKIMPKWSGLFCSKTKIIDVRHIFQVGLKTSSFCNLQTMPVCWPCKLHHYNFAGRLGFSKS